MTEITQLTEIVAQSGLEPAQQKPLLDSFGKLFVTAHKLVAQGKGIVVTSIDQVEEMKKAREIRLSLKDLRVEADKARKTLKEGYLRGGNAVQAIYNDIEKVIKPEEDRLLEQEKFAEKIETERKLKVEAQRIAKLSVYVDDAQGYSLHPDKMSEETFGKLLENSKLAFEAKKKAEEEAEEARKKAEEEERKENERIRLENQKLKEEQEKREAEMAKERAKQEEILAAERKAKKELEDKIEADRQAQLAAEQKRKEDELKAFQAEKEARLAPDKDKLRTIYAKTKDFILQIREISLANQEAENIKNDLINAMNAQLNNIEKKAKEL